VAFREIATGGGRQGRSVSVTTTDAACTICIYSNPTLSILAVVAGRLDHRSIILITAESWQFPDLADEDDDLLSESEMPDIVLGTTPSPEPEEEVATGKRKRKDERKERKRKRRELPTFGSYED
jgi:hypothetical protein